MISVSIPELGALQRDLRAANRVLERAERSKLHEAAPVVKRDMEASAAAAGMMKAARAVSVSVSGNELDLKVDGNIAPNARPLDKPNRGDFNHHPVFGSRNWVDQPARRFFNRGADAGYKVCEDKSGNALDDMVRSIS